MHSAAQCIYYMIHPFRINQSIWSYIIYIFVVYFSSVYSTLWWNIQCVKYKLCNKIKCKSVNCEKAFIPTKDVTFPEKLAYSVTQDDLQNVDWSQLKSQFPNYSGIQDLSKWQKHHKVSVVIEIICKLKRHYLLFPPAAFKAHTFHYNRLRS